MRVSTNVQVGFSARGAERRELSSSATSVRLPDASRQVSSEQLDPANITVVAGPVPWNS